MDPIYAICRSCDSMIVPPTAYRARLDGAAQVHARVTGHDVEVLSDSDPDDVLYVVAGEPALFGIGQQPD
jgi:hypothetical protein